MRFKFILLSAYNGTMNMYEQETKTSRVEKKCTYDFYVYGIFLSEKGDNP